ncbi:MAG: hypothetical protein KDJ22_11775 [Candidatus Competibacteraceae bacterium]|nr:hypothetical protein [Candidatus Competibacteraceae bacterium]
MNDLLNFNDLLAFIKANWAPLFVAAVLMPFILNLVAGVWRRICNRFRTWPTFATGAIYVDCVTPSGGYFPRLRCVRNGLLSVTMETPEGAKFLVYNKELRDGWVLPILYDPMLDRGKVRDDWVDRDVGRRRLHDGDVPASGKNEDVRYMLSERWRPGRD